MPKQSKPPIVGMQPGRMYSFDIRAVKAEERRVTVSFSSEQPVSRWFGAEILQHDEGSVLLDRINEIGVALFNHDRYRVVGRIENARLDTVEKKTYADIVFDTDPESEIIFQKVQGGTLKGTSVGYKVDVWEEVMPGKMSSNGRFTGPAYIATRWAPVEISIASVPADDTVGVGREAEPPAAYNNAQRSEVSPGSLSIVERQLQINKNFFKEDR